VTLETEVGRWAVMRGHDLNHHPENEPQPVDSADITASGLYWRRTERRFEPARAEAKWAMYAVSASDDGMSGPRWPRTHMLVANPGWWDLMLLRHLPYQVYNMSYDIAHRCVRTRRWVQTEDDCVALRLRLWCMWCCTALPSPPRYGRHFCPFWRGLA